MTSNLHAQNDLFEQMAMALFFFFRAMAEQCHRLGLRQFLDQSQCKLLPVVSDDPVLPIGPAALKHLRLISARIGFPIDLLVQKTSQQRFARSQIRHPDVAAIFLYPATPKAGHQDAQAVSFRIEGGMD